MPHKDPEAAKASKRAYYLAHKEQWTKSRRKWKDAHREEIAEASRRYYAENKEKHLVAVKSLESQESRISRR